MIEHKAELGLGIEGVGPGRKLKALGRKWCFGSRAQVGAVQGQNFNPANETGSAGHKVFALDSGGHTSATFDTQQSGLGNI